MNKLAETENNDTKLTTKEVKVVKTILASRMMSPDTVEVDPDDPSKDTPILRFNEKKGASRKYRKVPCTPDVYAMVKSSRTKSRNSPGPYDLLSTDNTEFAIGLDKEGVAVRVDTICRLPKLAHKVKIAGEAETGEQTVEISYHADCNSYYVSSTPRGMTFVDIRNILKSLDNAKQIKAGLEVTGNWEVDAVQGSNITLRSTASANPMSGFGSPL